MTEGFGAGGGALCREVISDFLQAEDEAQQEILKREVDMQAKINSFGGRNSENSFPEGPNFCGRKKEIQKGIFPHKFGLAFAVVAEKGIKK